MEGFRQDDFGGRVAGQVVEEGLGIGGFLHPEIAGGEIEHGEAVGLVLPVEPGEIVGARGLEHRIGQHGAGGDDAGDLALDDALGLGGIFHLVAEGDLLAGAQELGQVEVDGVVGDAAHRRALPLGERDAEDFRGDDGILEKHLVEVAQAEEQNGVGGDFRLGAAVLRHHGGCGFCAHCGPESEANPRAPEQPKTSAEKVASGPVLLLLFPAWMEKGAVQQTWRKKAISLQFPAR